jgi:hypothetical protein
VGGIKGTIPAGTMSPACFSEGDNSVAMVETARYHLDDMIEVAKP